MWPCLTLCDLWLPSAYVALEQQLEMLGQRWANICKWVEDQWLHLQQMLTRWQHFNDEQKQFSEWLSEKEEVLARMRLVDLSDISEVIEQVQQLKVRTCSCRIVHPLDGATYTHKTISCSIRRHNLQYVVTYHTHTWWTGQLQVS